VSRDPFKDDRKACLLAALETQHGLCFWCRCQLIVLEAKPNKDQYKFVTHYHATLIRETGKSEILYIASADHLVPQCMGGWTDIDNIVAACKLCNEDRGHLHNLHQWYVLDASGFEQWRTRVCAARKHRQAKQKAERRLTTSLRPALEAALSGAKVLKLERKKTA
jgi:HNH endonuclease